LRAWLGTEPAPPELEFEAMVRLTFADQGTKQQALAAIDSIARHAEQRYREGLSQLRGYLDDGGPFPQRLHLIALTPPPLPPSPPPVGPGAAGARAAGGRAPPPPPRGAPNPRCPAAGRPPPPPGGPPPRPPLAPGPRGTPPGADTATSTTAWGAARPG